MAETRYTDGSVTVVLDGALEELVRRALEAAGGETLRLVEAAAEEVASQARSQWYEKGVGVSRRTGKSGDIQVITTVSDDEVRVGVGSTDTSMVGRKPRVVLIHRPGRLALVDKLVGQREYWKWKKANKPVGPMGTPGNADWIIKVPSDNASDGKQILPLLVVRPMKAKMKAITPELAKAIAAQATKGGR